MASVFLYHVVGDLTVGKPELCEFSESETVAAAIRAIGESTEGGIPVWRKRSQKCAMENAETRQQRFVGILNALDVVAFLARDDSLADQDKALNIPVSEVVVPNNAALKVVDPGTRLVTPLLPSPPPLSFLDSRFGTWQPYVLQNFITFISLCLCEVMISR